MITRAGPAIDARHLSEFKMDQLGVKDHASWVTKYVDDNLGAK